jgi:hypothetical protein
MVDRDYSTSKTGRLANGPGLHKAVMNHVTLAKPLFICTSMKIPSDGLLFCSFCRTQPP